MNMNNYMPTPNFYDDYIAHYGVLGMRWGVRKQERQVNREKRKKAKQYQKQMNKLQLTETDYALAKRTYKARRDENTAKAIRYMQKMNRKPSEKIANKFNKLMAENKILTKKISHVDKDYKKNRKQIDSLLNKIKNDKDVLYLVKPGGHESFGFRMGKYRSELSKKYGTTKDPRGDAGSLVSMTGNKYKVAANTDRNAKKKKYKDPYRKMEGAHTAYRTTVYIY